MTTRPSRQGSPIAALVVLLAVALSAQSADTPLPRRPALGVALAPHDPGVAVTAVADGSAAKAAGVRAGDVIRGFDGVVMHAPPDVIEAVAKHRAGETATLEIDRDGTIERRAIRLGSVALEMLPDTTFEYGSVTLGDGSRLRTIVSVPQRAGRMPAVMLLQGGGCGSIDVPLSADSAMSGVLRRIALQGYVTMRVEKSGVGDSQGPPCADIGYVQELDGYRAALAALKRHAAVDAGQVYLLGLSLGGLFAPIVAVENPVRGIVTFGAPPFAPTPYPGRSERFFREIATIELEQAWSTVAGRVLVMYGQFDEVAQDMDRGWIARVVNRRRPGAATQVELTGQDHCWSRHPSMEASRDHCGQGTNEEALVAGTILAFLKGTPLTSDAGKTVGR
jgi:dienelactone hydrolase